MAFLVRAFPLRQSVADFEAFASAMRGPRQAEASSFYERYRIEHESWHLQHTEHGPWVIVVTVVHDLAASSQEYAQASDEFSSWFKGQVLTLSGVDPTVAPLGPPTTEVYRWSATQQIAHTFAT